MSPTAQTGGNATPTNGTDAPPAAHADAFAEIGTIVHEGLSELKGQLKQMGLRTRKDVHFTTAEDFRRADPSLKRLLVIGCTGSGKSTLLNLIGGWRRRTMSLSGRIRKGQRRRRPLTPLSTPVARRPRRRW